MTPKVTVLMAVHNGERFLPQALDTILGQSFRDFEFLVVDDASTDATGNILDSCADPRLVRLANDSNLGLTVSLNRGLEAAKGAYIARMDADDLCRSERLARQVVFLDDRPDVGAVGCAGLLMDQDGNPGREVRFPEEHGLLLWRMCLMENPIIHPSVMFRREAVLQAGGYDPEFRVSQDYDLWSRLAVHWRLANLAEALVYLRKHSGSVSASGHAEQKRNSLLISSRILGSLTPFPPAPRFLEGACDVYWEPSTAGVDSVHALAALLIVLCAAFREKGKFSLEVMEAIRLDARARLVALKHHPAGQAIRGEIDNAMDAVDAAAEGGPPTPPTKSPEACLGALRGLPDPEGALRALCVGLAPGEKLVLRNCSTASASALGSCSKLLRAVLTRLPPAAAEASLRVVFQSVWPLHKAARQLSGTFPCLRGFCPWLLAASPVKDPGEYRRELSPRKLKALALRRTRSALIAGQESPLSMIEALHLLRACGLQDVREENGEIGGYGPTVKS